VVNPLTIDPDATLADALALMKENNISGVPVVEGGGNGQAGKLVGILTNRDVRFEKNLGQRVRDVMTTRLITASETITLDASKELLHKNRIEALVVVDGAGAGARMRLGEIYLRQGRPEEAAKQFEEVARQRPDDAAAPASIAAADAQRALYSS